MAKEVVWTKIILETFLEESGIKNGSNKLTEEEVKEIYLSNLGCTTLSKKYNVSKTNIRYIKNKQQWKWLTDTFD